MRVYEDNGHVRFGEVRNIRLLWWQGNDQDSICASPARHVADTLIAAGGRLDIVDDEVVIGLDEGIFDTAQAFDDGGAREERNDDRNRIGAPARQSASGGIGDIIEFGDRALDAGARFLIDERTVVDDPGDCPETDPGAAGDVANCD